VPQYEGLDDYERKAWQDIQAWKKAPPGPVARTFGKALAPVDKVLDKYVMRGAVVKAIEGVVSVAMDAGNWTTNKDSLLERLQKDGYPVRELDDIPQHVSLKVLDQHVSRLPAYYKAGLTAEGAGVGAVALIGPWWAAGALGADLAAVTTTSCRCIAHFGAYYGYDAGLLHERHFAMTVLGGAGALTETGKAAAIAEVGRVANQVAKKKAWEELNKSTLVKTLQQIAKQFGVNLTKKKLGQLIAGIGIAVGAGVNYWYVDQIAENAYYHYRERFLRDKQEATRRMRSQGELAEPEPEPAEAEVVDEDDDEAA
jgi:hypothetical protein